MSRITAENAPKELSAHVETAGEAAIAEAEAASRHAAVAQKLLSELSERAKQLITDPAVLEHADAIEALVVESGAVRKAATDLERLEKDLDTAEAELARLCAAAGMTAGGLLSSSAIAALRELARAHAEDAAALTQIAETRRDLELRREPLAVPEEIVDDTLGNLLDAVDAARGLGADADIRRAEARRSADDVAETVGVRLAQLAPWTGSIAQLRALPDIGQSELDAAKATWNEHSKSVSAEEDEARRHDEEAAKVELQIKALPSGSAISEEQVAAARDARSDAWTPIRAHLVCEAPLDDAESAAEIFESAVNQADILADRRFALADASGRLAALETAMAARKLEADQARERREASARKSLQLKQDWEARLQTLGLPQFEPIQLEGWLEARDSVLEAEAERARKTEEADAFEARHTSAITALRTQLGEEESTTPETLFAILARAERARIAREGRLEQGRSNQQQLAQIDADIATQDRKRAAIETKTASRAREWQNALAGTGVELEIVGADARLSTLDELRRVTEQVASLGLRMEGIRRDAKRFSDDLAGLAEKLALPDHEDDQRLLQSLKSRLQQAQTTARLHDEITKEVANRTGEEEEAAAQLEAAMTAVTPLYAETEATNFAELAEVIERSRSMRRDRATLAEVEGQIVRQGDGLPLEKLVASLTEAGDLDALAASTETMGRELASLNAAISEAARAHGEAERAFNDLEDAPAAAANAASDAEQARAEMAVQAEAYILKRAQALTLRWAIEEYRQRHQDPLLVRASELFSTLTLGRYSELKVDLDDGTPRLLGITEDGRTAIEVDGMSEGTTDQLFLALRLAAVEQSVAAGVPLPFLADDLFVNFDDDRAAAGFRVLAELSRKTQVLFFTHHQHLATIARQVVGDDAYSECVLT